MLKLIDGATPRRVVAIRVQGQEVRVREGVPLATALLEAGIEEFRKTPVSGAPRGPLCLMGVCFDCLVNVNGRRNVQACMVEVTAGMDVQLPQGAGLTGAVHDA